MFPVLGLFHSLPCPDNPCTRAPCLFSHKDTEDLPPPKQLDFPVQQPKPKPKPQPQPQPQPQLQPKSAVVKRQISQSPGLLGFAAGEPPRKLQRTGTITRPVAVPTSNTTSNGVPVLRVNAAQSFVAVPVRQTMLKTLYDHFTTLYSSISRLNPTLAAEHALKQEEEVYKKSSKLTYRNAVIQCVAAIKRRAAPDSVSHPSVGTEDEIKDRAERAKSLESLVLTRKHLQPLIMSHEDMEKWGFMVQIPEGPGGDQPSAEGQVMKCERCAQPFQVARIGPETECVHHWGKPQMAKVGGEKVRMYTCCSRPVVDSEGCVHGRHVFYESSPHQLHSRHAFSTLRPPQSTDSALDVVAIDCEMVYTTGGFRVARVSVVDGKGKSIFDELVRMDDGVYIIDYITRFSGITKENHTSAVLPLDSIRKSLDSIINSETILVGHGLDNDLKTMRIVHNKCVDTAILFPHRAGPPYRRALRDLVREKLGKFIQTGDASVGHSSAEDASATLDLVRWYILNRPTKTSTQTTAASTSTSKPSTSTLTS